ncbi:MAG: hypothetical protein EHM20_10835, partial [Alphaproteobacteria bacterium]
MRKFVAGYTMIFAIAVIIIVSSFALLFLSYFKFNYEILNSTENFSLARQYCYKTFTQIDQSNIEYDNIYKLRVANGYQLKKCKKRWGLFDLYFSTVSKNAHDTLFSKIALVGYQKASSCDLSLYLRRTNSILNVGDSVYIRGKCFVPTGSIKNLGKATQFPLNNAQFA